MKKRIKSFIIFFLFVLLCSLHTKSIATMECTAIQDSDVMYVNSTFTNINLEEYNAYQRGMTAEEYYSKTWSEKYAIDKYYLLFGSIDAKCGGGRQNGYYNEHVYGAKYGAVQNLAKDKLSNGNLCIVDEYTNGTNLFPTTNTNPNIYKEVLSNWKFPFVKEENGYYSFDSDNYHIYRDYNTNSFKLHKGARGGFFPFNNCEDDTFSKNNRELAFTARMDIPFTMTSDGKILNSKTNEKEDMIFNFSADDDLWVYVDGNLILDIGGCHRRTSGNINFAQNQVYYESIYHLEVNTSEKDVYKTAFENGMLEPGEHTLTVFYIERSGDNANLSISFNLEQGNVETEYIDIDTNKVLSTEKQEGPLGKKVTTNAKNITGYTLVKKPESETFTIKKESQTVKYYYAKNTTVTAKYIDKITNEEILDKVTISGKSGDKYEILQKIINGYDLIKIDGNPKGTMKGEPINIIYYYKHKSKIIVNYIDKETGKLIGQKEEIYYEGDIFNPEIRNYEGYKIVEGQNNEPITVKREDITLNYYYQWLKFNLRLEMNLDKAYINGYYYGLDNKAGKIETNIISNNKDNSIEIFYKIIVTNNGEKAGSGYINFTIPEGFKMKTEDWVIDNNVAKYKVTDLNIGETREYKIVIQKSEGVNISGNIKTVASIDSEKFQEITIDDNKDINELAIMPRTGGKYFNVIPIIIIMTAIAILIVIIKKHSKSINKSK